MRKCMGLVGVYFWLTLCPQSPFPWVISTALCAKWMNYPPPLSHPTPPCSCRSQPLERLVCREANEVHLPTKRGGLPDSLIKCAPHTPVSDWGEFTSCKCLRQRTPHKSRITTLKTIHLQSSCWGTWLLSIRPMPRCRRDWNINVTLILLFEWHFSRCLNRTSPLPKLH